MTTRRATSWYRILFAGLLLSVAAASAAEHPNHARFKPDHSFQLGDLDHVNLFNGNLVATLPIGQTYPVGGQLSYGLALS